MGRLLPLPSGTSVHISRFGVIPKGHTPGRWQMITDLSSPHGASVDTVAQRAWQMGQGALLAKADIKSAYRIVPVHPEDISLLGVEWDGKRYVDCMLPFGLRSAPKIFNALADALQWVCQHAGVQDIFHYLDDFAIVGPLESSTCANHVHIFQWECAALGVPLASDKTEGPTTCLTLLGIEIDTVAGELRLLPEKLSRLKELVRGLLGRGSCTRRELESAVGFLQHAATVVKPGKSFMRRMFALLNSVDKPHYFIKLGSTARADLAWWDSFAQRWNGRSIAVKSATVTVTSDASGFWGCGAFLDRGEAWFQWEWPPAAAQKNIAVKEMYPILIAAACWGHRWLGKTVRCRSDNQAVVSVIASRYSWDQDLMHLLRCLFFFEAHFDFSIAAEHVPGVEYGLADDLSRNRCNSFLLQVPNASKTPTPLHEALTELVLDTRAQWTSPAWTKQFTSIVYKE